MRPSGVYQAGTRQGPGRDPAGTWERGENPCFPKGLSAYPLIRSGWLSWSLMDWMLSMTFAWWFGTWLYFPFHIRDNGVILPIDFHTFQDG